MVFYVVPERWAGVQKLERQMKVPSEQNHRGRKGGGHVGSIFRTVF